MTDTYELNLTKEEIKKYDLFMKTILHCESMLVGQWAKRFLCSKASKQLELLLQYNFNLVYLRQRTYVDRICYFVDYENINKLALCYLRDIKNAIIYLITNTNQKINYQLFHESNLVYVESHHGVYKNYADFMLDFSILKLVRKHRFPNIEIISDDKGFIGMVDIVKEKYNQPCLLVGRKEIVNTRELSLNEVIDDIKCLLENTSKKRLPKNKNSLKQYIQNTLYATLLDDSLLNNALQEICYKGMICFYGETIHYHWCQIHGH